MEFNPDTDIPDLSGRVVVVTGGTDGLGKQSVLQLAKHNPYKIYLAARSADKASSAISEIRSALSSTSSTTTSTASIEFLKLDLSSLASVKSAAQQFLAHESRLDILLCNAGVFGSTGVTTDGYEIQMGVNHLGHALLIRLLLPIMTKTAQSDLPAVHPGSTRCVILGSEAESKSPTTAYDFPAMKSEMQHLGMLAKYGQSKLANIHYTAQLALRYPEATSGVRFVSVHPGGVTTNLGNDLLANWPVVAGFLRRVISTVLRLVTVEEGAKGQLWACTAVEGPENGVFYWPVGVEGKGSWRVGDMGMAEGLWGWTEEVLKGEL